MHELIVSPLDLREKPERIFARMHGRSHPLFLDSRGGPNARMSFLACDPCQVFRSRGACCEVWKPQTGWKTTQEAPLKKLEELLAERKTARPAGPFWTGAAGYISYDFAWQLEDLPRKNVSDLPLYDLYLCFYNTVLAHDVAEGAWYLVQRPDADPPGQDFLQSLIAAPFPQGAPEPIRARFAGTNLAEAQFSAMVERTREYIAAGDIYQANLSQRLELLLESNPFDLYGRLLALNPSPFAAYLEFGDVCIGSCSPERLFRIKGNRIETRPIAGTRKRGKTPEEDSAMYEELLKNEKERAEHLMLVDLERNDIGRVSRYGTVKVDEFMVREAYSHVWHIVSNVSGELREGLGAAHALAALFPGGTITGTPKIRAMQIIEELEPVQRGLYTGSIGYFADSGDCDLNIVIRTFIVHKQKAYIQVGAGIVADSVPHREYRETFNKAAALLAAAGVETTA